MRPFKTSLCTHFEQRPLNSLQARHQVILFSTRSHEIRCSSSDTPIKSPANPGFPQPSNFRPRTFSVPRRFTPLDNLPVLFHTGATPEVQRANIIRNHCAFTPGKPEKSACCYGELSPQVNTIRAILAGMINIYPQDKQTTQRVTHTTPFTVTHRLQEPTHNRKRTEHATACGSFIPRKRKKIDPHLTNVKSPTPTNDPPSPPGKPGNNS